MLALFYCNNGWFGQRTTLAEHGALTDPPPEGNRVRGGVIAELWLWEDTHCETVHTARSSLSQHEIIAVGPVSLPAIDSIEAAVGMGETVARLMSRAKIPG